MAPDVLAVGGLVWETTALLPELPGEDQIDRAGVATWVDRASYVVHDGGGSAANTLVVAASLGLRSCFVGVSGDDEEGLAAQRSLEAAGVDVRVQRLAGRSTKRNIVLAEAGTGRTTFRAEVPGRAARPVQVADVPRDLLLRARVLHLDRVSRTGLALAGERAAAGLPTTLDLHSLPWRTATRERLARVVPLLSVVKVSQDAWPALGSPVPAGWTVVTMGAAGAMAWDRGHGPFDVPAERVDRFVEPTGAGDAFAAGLIAGWLGGSGLVESCALASRLAARACAALGPRGAFKGGGRS